LTLQTAQPNTKYPDFELCARNLITAEITHSFAFIPAKASFIKLKYVMNSYVRAASLLLVFYILYYFVKSFLSSRYHARRAEELGCEPVPVRPAKLPGGIDFIWRLTKADRRNQVPNELEAIFADMGAVFTWKQYVFGTATYNTVDPKNIQALLATQFLDFEIGPLRRGNFFPMLGNGIFTSDGKAW